MAASAAIAATVRDGEHRCGRPGPQAPHARDAPACLGHQLQADNRRLRAERDKARQSTKAVRADATRTVAAVMAAAASRDEEERLIDHGAEPADSDSSAAPFAPVALPQVLAQPPAPAQVRPQPAALPQVGEDTRNDGTPSKRTRITHTQLVQLAAAFGENSFPDTQKRARLAVTLNLPAKARRAPPISPRPLTSRHPLAL